MKTKDVQTILAEFQNEMSYVERIEFLSELQDGIIYWALESRLIQDDVENILNGMFTIRRLAKLLTDLNNAEK